MNFRDIGEIGPEMKVWIVPKEHLEIHVVQHKVPTYIVVSNNKERKRSKLYVKAYQPKLNGAFKIILFGASKENFFGRLLSLYYLFIY